MIHFLSNALVDVRRGLSNKPLGIFSVRYHGVRQDCSDELRGSKNKAVACFCLVSPEHDRNPTHRCHF
jgi:hypothetical protein